MKPWAWIMVATIAVVVIVVLATYRPSTPSAPNAMPNVPVAAVRSGVVDETIELAGRIGPAAGTQTKLAFSVAGVLSHVGVSLGERVRAGEALAQLDAAPYALAAQQASASAQAASAQAANARVDRWSVKLRVDEAELVRQRLLLHAGVIAQRDLQAQEATVASDRAEVQSARDQIAAAQAQAASASAQASSASYDLARTTLRAPSDGVVVGIYAQPGEELNSTTPVIALAPQMAGVATLDVPVVDVSRIAGGDVVRIDAAGRHFDARIGGVAPAVDPATGLATLSVVGVPSDIAPGTPVDATVVYGHARGLIVPSSSLVADPQTGQMLVFVEGRGKDGSQAFSARRVAAGVQSSGSTVVTGLRPGERVAVQGAIDLLAPPSSDGGD